MDDDKKGGGKLAPRELVLTSSEIEWIFGHFQKNPGEMFLSPAVSAHVAVNRLSRVPRGDVRTYDETDEAVIGDTVAYNLEELRKNSALARPKLLIDALKSIHFVTMRSHDMKVLSIGPRSEAELLMLFAAGFRMENVRGLDLISYSEFVDLGDMHDMPYDDDSFDVILLGWVLGYSNDCQKVADEVMRVARPGAYVAIGCEREPPKNRNAPGAAEYDIAGTRFETTEEYVALFGDNVHAVPVRHEVHRRFADRMCHVIAVIELK